MIANGGRNKVAERREAKVASIVAAAWQLAREHGVAGLSLHALAREVGMRQPSLYEYFDSKHALYDAMFVDGNRQLLERLDALRLPRDPRAAVKKYMRTFMDFAIEDAARSELLFQRHIPGLRARRRRRTRSPRTCSAAPSKLLHEAGVTSKATSTAWSPWSPASWTRS